MKIFGPLLLILFPLCSGAQSEGGFGEESWTFSYGMNETPRVLASRRKYYEEKKIKTWERYEIKDGKDSHAEHLRFSWEYDTLGNLLTTITYDKDRRVKTRSFNSYGKFGRIDSSVTYRRDSVPAYRYSYLYWQDTLLIWSHYYRGRNLSDDYSWRHEYYEDGQRKLSEYYNRRGRLVHRYSFACNEKGKEVADLKDTTEVCRKEDYTEDGLRKVVLESSYGKNKMSRDIYYYRDSLLVRREILGSGDRYLWGMDMMYTPEGKYCGFISYRKNRRLSYVYTVRMDTAAQSAAATYISPRKVRKYKYFYDEKGCVKESLTIVNGKTKRHYRNKIVYFM